MASILLLQHMSDPPIYGSPALQYFIFSDPFFKPIKASVFLSHTHDSRTTDTRFTYLMTARLSGFFFFSHIIPPKFDHRGIGKAKQSKAAWIRRFSFLLFGTAMAFLVYLTSSLLYSTLLYFMHTCWERLKAGGLKKSWESVCDLFDECCLWTHFTSTLFFA